LRHTTGVLHFTDLDVALDACVEHEHATADQPRVEVVPISAVNEDLLREGCSHMFMLPGLPTTFGGWAQFLHDEEWRDYLSGATAIW
jgi:hypothetical protein